MIRANLSGMTHNDPERRTFIMGDQTCPSCGQRSCGGECAQAPSLDRRPPMTDEELR